MERFTPILRISAGLALLTCSILVVVDLLGLLPSPTDAALQSRVHLCETLAAQTAAAGAGGDLGSARAALQVAVRRNEDVLSAGLRTPRGRLLVSIGDHANIWVPPEGASSTSTQVQVPLFRADGPWATLEVLFAPIQSTSWASALWERPLTRLLLLVGGAGFLLYMLYMRRTLRHLDPSAVIPTRVQAALDVMAEGVLLLDDQGRIVLANSAFTERLGRAASSLLGADVKTLGWKTSPHSPEGPWANALRESQTSTGTPMRIETEHGEERIWVVNASPVLDGWGRPKGAILTFDDVTELEARTAELKQTMVALEESQEEIRLQNEELQQLAKTDPLTGIANRRAFMERFESPVATAKEDGVEICCVMADIDHFKSVNDTHGHAAGDEVIRRIAELFASTLRSTDEVCRYGGEEFCIVLDGTPAGEAAQVAERLRRAIEAPGFARVQVTTSFGMSSTAFGASELAKLIDQADQALYAAKRGGRNRVVRFDEMEHDASLGGDA